MKIHSILRDLKSKLEIWLFRPVSPYPLAAFRILFGLCVSATLLLLHGDWLNWFGTHSWVTLDTIQKAEGGFRLDIFAFVPQHDAWITALFWFFLMAAFSLTLGLCSRISSVAVFLALNSLNQRMPLILHGGDTFLRCAGFFLIFAPSGAAWSVDRLIRNNNRPVRVGALAPAERTIPPWPQRLIQFQLAVVYLASFIWKAKGEPWWNGTALFYVQNLREMQRFPVPHLFHLPFMVHLETWAALVFELSFPLLVWFRPFRNPLLLAGLAFHLVLEYALNIPMFQWDILSAYVLFLDGDAFAWLMRAKSSRSRPETGSAYPV